MNERLMLGLELAGVVLVVAFAGLRLYVGFLKRWRPYRFEIFGVSTYLLGVACALFCFGHWSSDGVRMVKWRAQGMHDEQIRFQLLTSTDFKFIYASSLFATTSLWAAKASFLASYAGLYLVWGPKMRALYVGACVYCILTWIGTMAAYSFVCMPISRNWTLDANFCATVLEPQPLHIGLPLHLTSDFLLLSIPLIMILRMSKRSKAEIFGVTLIVSLGLMSVAMILYRAIDSERMGFTKGKPLTLPKRNLYVVQEMVMLVSMLGAFIVPSLKVFLRKKEEGRGRKGVWGGTALGSMSGKDSPTFRELELGPTSTVEGSWRA